MRHTKINRKLFLLTVLLGIFVVMSAFIHINSALSDESDFKKAFLNLIADAAPSGLVVLISIAISLWLFGISNRGESSEELRAFLESDDFAKIVSKASQNISATDGGDTSSELMLPGLSGFRPIDTLVPKSAQEVALVGQNLVVQLGKEESDYKAFLDSIRRILSRQSLKRLILVTMTPNALNAIHQAAAADLKKFTLKRFGALSKDLGEDRDRLEVIFHPSATLSLLAIDWSYPPSQHAYITPKFQRTSQIRGRISIRLDGEKFDAASFERMVQDAIHGTEGAKKVMLGEAEDTLAKMIKQAKI